MTQKDKDQRVEFAQKIQAESLSVQTDSVAFYLDGVSFVNKTNPLDQARAPKVEYEEKDLKASHKGAWQKAVNLEWEEKWLSSWQQ